MAEQTAPSYMIIGNGIAGATAAEVLRAEDSAATITVIADDPFPVYYRPALKDYLAGRISEDKLWARPASFYQDHTIRFLPDRVVGIGAAQHRVQLQSGRQVSYDRLLLANGARPASLRCPGLNLVGVYTLRTVADYQAVLENLGATRRVVVSGSGTLALETIETLRHRGYAVTHLVRRRTLWSEVLDATASDLVLQQERRDGVDVRLGEEIAEITGRRNEVSGVVSSSGVQIACETVIIAVGIEPNIDFIKASGIACGRGVRVDGKMHTNTVDIFAAGDVLESQDVLTGRTRLIGQWYPSIQQGRAAAYSMLDLLDTNRPFNSGTFYNATFLYGLDFASVGLTNASGLQEVVAEPKPRTYRKVLLKDGVPVGMLALGDRRQVLAFKRAIDHRINLQTVASVMLTDSFKIGEWLDSQGVPPPLLGVARQGDAAVKQAAYASAQASPSATVIKPQLSESLLVIAEKMEGVLAETRLSPTKVMTVGRQQGVHLLVDEATVSRRHAEISYVNGQFVLHDLGSSNGTFVNGGRLQPASAYVLKPGDTVRFGKVVNFNFVARVISGQAKNMQVGSVSMAGITGLQDAMGERVDPLGQPLLRSDGSLLLPGATTPLSAAVVASFKQSAALVVLADVAGTSQRPPQVFLLKEGRRAVVGRDQGMDIELADPVVSRRHAEISPGPGGFYIRDLGSSNGVTVNQTRIDNPYHLAHGDRVSLGGCMLYFVDLRTPNARMVPVAELAGVSARDEQSARIENGGRGGADQTVQRRLVASEVSGREGAPSSELVICSKCGGVNTRIARFCASCSAPLLSQAGS